jgi:hypothetical protein
VAVYIADKENSLEEGEGRRPYVEGTPVEGKNHPRDQRLHREEEAGTQEYETMQFEADGHSN